MKNVKFKVAINILQSMQNNNKHIDPHNFKKVLPLLKIIGADSQTYTIPFFRNEKRYGFYAIYSGPNEDEILDISFDSIKNHSEIMQKWFEYYLY